MSGEDVSEKIFDIIARHTRADRQSLTRETRLSDLTNESLQLVEILFAVEEAFSVYVPEYDESFKLTTLGDVVDGVQKLLGTTRQGA